MSLVHSGLTPCVPNENAVIEAIMRLTGYEYSAASPTDVMHLAFVVECVPDDKKASVAAAIIANDLMRGPWWFQALVGLIRLRGRTAERLTFLYSRNPALASDLLVQTARHIRHGKDREDTTSVGGLSQRETDILISVLRVNGRGPVSPDGYEGRQAEVSPRVVS